MPANNLLYDEAATEIIERVKKLQPGTPALWGRMNATEMLLHSNLCNSEIFEPVKPQKPTTPKQFLLRLLALYIAPKFKRGVAGDRAKETAGKGSIVDFEKEKERFIILIKHFVNYKGELTLPHIAFGNISTNEWGIAAYKHMDHHLRQFGV